MHILVTGAAGFIGMHVAERLLERGDTVVGLDNLNAYYDVSLKRSRLERLTQRAGFSFVHMDVAARDSMGALFGHTTFDAVVHLAAQAGVRYSIEHPEAYVDSNLVGFLSVLEGCRHSRVGHLVYASSSSVYGSNVITPFHESQSVDHPVSLYAATKKANELMAHSYSHLFGLPTTGLRFFTVYGPWGRPDMALFKFTKTMLDGQPIDLYNEGRMVRDFTYIDDIVNGVVGVLDRIPEPDGTYDAASPDPSRSHAPYRVFNIGNNEPVQLMTFVEALEGALGVTAQKRLLPLQAGDVLSTHAEVSSLAAWTGVTPSTPIEEGVRKFVAWYRAYYSR